MLGYFWVIASAFLYGSLVVISKYIYGHGVDPLTLLVINGASATAALWLMVLLTGSKHWKLQKGVLRHILLQGSVGTFVTSAGFFVALQYIDASIAILLLFIHPVIVLFFEVAFDKKPLLRCHLIALALCITGLVIVVDPFPLAELEFSFIGFALAGVASVALAFNNWYGEKNITRSSPFAVMIWTTTTQAILFVAISPSSVWQGLQIPPLFLFFIIVMALLTWVAPNFMILKGIEAIGASHASLIGSLEVVFTMVLAVLLLHERISILEGLGAVLIVAGIFFLPHGDKEPVAPINPL